ncbi:hypothetical protein [Vibrio vulnificus]|uniref:hypothetical protein n=1 Tax=Vibrio vulnificus TaxID=672 RepID=UPI0032429E76
MKKMISLVALISLNVQAHGMYPTGNLEAAYATSNFHKVEFSVQNMYEDRTCYEVEINGKLMTPYTVCLKAKERKEMSVYVESKPNEWSVNEVCSLSPVIGMARTRMCLKSQSYYFVQ